MCGIIAYFGDRESSLTGILGAMASILYRAPDSTGLAWFGTTDEPIKIRKTVGTLTNLIETQFKPGTNPGHAEFVLPLFSGGGEPKRSKELQNRLLKREQLKRIEAADCTQHIECGTCGDPEPYHSFSLAEEEKVRSYIIEAIEKYDLPPQVIRMMAHSAVKDSLKTGAPEREAAILLDRLLNKAFRSLGLEAPSPGTRKGVEAEPASDAESVFANLIIKTTVTIHPDLDPDIIRRVFRILDSGILSATTAQQGFRSRIQHAFEQSWSGEDGEPVPKWHTVYCTEKLLNVFGRAAYAAWTVLDTPFQTGIDRKTAAFLSTPVIAHGRWALQSPVSNENAHPFTDTRRSRAVALNGQFSPAMERDLQLFLTQAGYEFTSSNSSEYLPLLWEHYFETFRYEQRRIAAIQAQVESGLDDYDLGSRTIDYRVLNMIRNKTDQEIDILAFREAVRKLTEKGGQVAVVGISLHSPRCLLVASHDRPVFIVRRKDTEEIMVVSDVYAALGLFSQKMIAETSKALKKLRREFEQSGTPGEKELKEKEEEILESFRVTVTPLEDEQKFACIETCTEGNHIRRTITITDFENNLVPNIEEFETLLVPLRDEETMFASTFETHLHEIPGCLQGILDAYLPEDAEFPKMNVKRRILQKRFGQKLQNLERVIPVGMGSSYHVGLMAKKIYHALMPSIEILPVKPVEIEHVLRLMEPEKDLVILLSWSGTTADMVEFARELEESNISFIVVTNKPFSELGLLAWRSLGVVNLVSGEELTISAVKSAGCMLLAVHLLAAWLASFSEKGKKTGEVLQTLRLLPEAVTDVLADQQCKHTLSTWAENSAGSTRGYIFDDLLYGNTGREIAWKLEENGSTLICRPFDYRDMLPRILTDSSDCLVLVNATGRDRMEEAVDLMKQLYMTDVPFFCLSYEQPLSEQIRFYSRGNVLVVPKLEDPYQSFIDLIVLYRFIQYFTEQSGLVVPGFPRNRVKSVTSARSRQKRFPSTAAELSILRRDLAALENLPDPDLGKPTLWERRSQTDWESSLYREIRETAGSLSRNDPVDTFFPGCGSYLDKLSQALFDEFGEGGEVLFLCCDRTAWAAGYEAAAVWGRLHQVPLRIFYQLDELHDRKEPLPVFVVASSEPGSAFLDQFRKRPSFPVCWVGPELDYSQSVFFKESLGYFPLPNMSPSAAYGCLYGGILLLLSTIWSKVSPRKGEFFHSLLRCAGKAVMPILEDGPLLDSIESFWRTNGKWDHAFYISPPAGIGYIWEELFDAATFVNLEHHVYGDSAHGPLASVDQQIDGKYVQLRPEAEMKQLYGENLLRDWKTRFGSELLEKDSGELRNRGLLYQDGKWYLPVMEPEYEFKKDNLIILDSTRARYLEQSKDEIEIFSCRYAQLLQMTQSGLKAVYRSGGTSPVSTAGDPIVIPPLDREEMLVPDLLLPFVSNIVAAAFASACSRALGGPGKYTIFSAQEARSYYLVKKLRSIGEALIDAGFTISMLDPEMLTSLERLVPVVASVETARAFTVRFFPSENILTEFIQSHSISASHKMLEQFQILRDKGLSFYLMKPEAPEGEWQNVFGPAWDALHTGTIQTHEGEDGRSLIDIPNMESTRREGRLFRLIVRYQDFYPATHSE